MAKHIQLKVRSVRFPRPRRRDVDRGAALVVLGIVSTSWTAGLAGLGSGQAADGDREAVLPDATVVLTEALEDPASYSQPGSLGLGVPKGSSQDVVQTASTNGIPSAALAAYQRAETVINAADKACNLPWQLIAAIGRVESDHGRYGNNTLDDNGVSRPGIYGIALDGTRNTAEITDTDAGQFDNDIVYDRAVGPMQFIPSTWSIVGVDADGDAKRNPQDIDDAALAAAVYLCSGSDNLGTDAGRRTSVYRYNHSNAYVDLVLSIMDAYMDGDYTSVPNYTTSAITFTPDYTYTNPTRGKGGKGGKGGSGTGGNGTTNEPAVQQPDDEQPPVTPTPVPEPTQTNDPAKQLGETIDKTIKDAGDTVKNITKTVASTLCVTEATTKNLTTPLVNDYQKFYAECMAKYGY